MAGLLFLGNEDFNIAKGNNGPILCNTLSGLSLILFYSKQCVHCNNLIPIFKKLPETINGCQFGMVNVSNCKNLINASKSTILPITYVPFIVLYVSSKPYMVYKGPHDIKEICRFIIEVNTKINNKQKFINEQNKQSKTTRVLQGTALPLYGDNDLISYLQFNEEKGYHISEKDETNFSKYNDNKGYYK